MPTKPRYLDKPTRDALTAIHGPTWPSMAPKALAEAIRRIRQAPRATFPRRTNWARRKDSTVETINITGTIQHESADPLSVELARGQRGGYGWTIKLRGKTTDEILAEIDRIDAQLRAHYSDGAQQE